LPPPGYDPLRESVRSLGDIGPAGDDGALDQGVIGALGAVARDGPEEQLLREGSQMSSAPDHATWSWAAEPHTVTRARHAVVEWLSVRGTAHTALDDVALVLSEAVGNAVRHAYAGREPGEIHVQVAVYEDELMVAVEDHGHGLRPRPDSPGIGYGLALMVAVAKRLEASAGEHGGTRLVAWFSHDRANGAGS
jgi:serine/threonine-protein kinase RsbW